MPCGIQVSANHLHMVPKGEFVIAHRTSHPSWTDISPVECRYYQPGRKTNFYSSHCQSNSQEKTMKTPETIYHHLIDSFTHGNVSFALYRLPWTDEPILIMQEEGQPDCISSLNELNQKKGFLLSPFHLTSFRPATLIRPDIQAHDWGENKIGPARMDYTPSAVYRFSCHCTRKCTRILYNF